VRKISPPPGFDPRTVQPVVSRYTDWATQPTINTRITDNQNIFYNFNSAYFYARRRREREILIFSFVSKSKTQIAIFGEQTARDFDRIWCDVSIHTVWFVKGKSFLWAALSYSTYDGNTIDLLPFCENSDWLFLVPWGTEFLYSN
jgi:hypothetical protein